MQPATNEETQIRAETRSQKPEAMESFLIFSFSPLHGYFHLADSLWPGFGSGASRPKLQPTTQWAPASTVVTQLTWQYVCNSALRESTNNKQHREKKMPRYLRLDTLIRRQTLGLADPGPGEPMAIRERAGWPRRCGGAAGNNCRPWESQGPGPGRNARFWHGWSA